MRSLWKSSLALSLGLLASGARADETVWRAIPVQASAPVQAAQPIPVPPASRQVIASSGSAAAVQIAPPVTPGPPVAASAGRFPPGLAPTLAPPVTTPMTGSVPAAQGAGVILERPVPIASTAPASQAGIQPASFSPSPQQSGPIIRGQVSDPTPDPAASPKNYRRPEELTIPPRMVPSTGTPAVPLGGNTLFATTPPVVGAPTIMGPIASTPGAIGPPVVMSPGIMSGPPIVGAPGTDCGPGCGSNCGAGCGGCAQPGGVCTGPGGCSGPNCCQGDGHNLFDGSDDCCFNNRWYVTGEYLLWTMKGDPTPPLATTGMARFVTDTNIGALGRPDTRVLFGGNSLGTGANSGARFSAGYWFFDDHCLGIEVGGFFLGENRTHFSASSNGSSELAIPFFDVNPNGAFQGESIQGVAGTRFVVPANGVNIVPAGTLAGNLDIVHKTNLWGAEVNLRSNCLCGPNGFLDFLLGYREVGLDESLTLHESLNVAANRIDPATGNVAVPAGSTYEGIDKFSTSNRFYGVQAGLIGEKQWGRWSLGFTGKLGLGPTQETVVVSGEHALQVPGAPPASVVSGNLFTQPTNIGRFSRDVFTVLPEGSLRVGYQFTDHIRATVGYNAMYWSNVARAGAQIDRSVNSAQVNGMYGTQPVRPAFNFNGSDFWAQGVSFGLEFRY